LSFFDEADEPQPRQETRRQRAVGSPRARSGRPPGGSGRPPRSQHEQEVQTRRLIAVGVIVVIIIVIAVLLAGSGGNSGALKNYNASVYQLIKGSTTNAQNALGAKGLESGSLSGTATNQDLATYETNARNDLTKAKGLHAPSELAPAQAALLTVMELRQQALLLIADNAQQAASKATSKDAVYQISQGTSQLYTSDVLYKTVVTIDIAKALNAAGIPIGSGTGEQQINGDQVIPDLGWLDQTWIADKIGAQQSTAAANANNDQPGLHGHSLGTFTVGGIALQAGVTNTIKASDARKWVLSVTNGGNFDEFQVGCSIKIVSLSDEGTGTIAETYPQQTGNCNVTLPSTPTTGPYQVVATVDKVPGESNLTNNTATYDVTFT
jgi:hypothetical protein